MNEKLRKLLKDAENTTLTDEERAEQRKSFAFGNAVLSNPRMTREMIEDAENDVDRRITEED